MVIKNVSCPTCGAPISVPEGIDYLNCIYCGAGLEIQRGEGYVALKVGEKVSRSIEETGVQTQSTIREGTSVTQAELKRLQLSQELSSLQFQLSTLKSEKRSLEREKIDRSTKRQIEELREEERDLMDRINTLQFALAGGNVGAAAVASAPVQGVQAWERRTTVTVKGDRLKDWRLTSVLALFLGWAGIHRFYTGYMLSGIIQLLTLGGLFIWWAIDLFNLATNRFRDSKGNALTNYGDRMGAGCLVGAVGFLGVFILMTFIGAFIADSSEGIVNTLMPFSFLAAIGAFLFWIFFGERKWGATKDKEITQKNS